MDKRPGTIVGHIVAFVARTEGRRLLVVVGVPIGFVALFELTANFGVLVLLFAAGFATFLYTRPTAQKTMAASAYGTGMLLIGFFLLELYLIWATVSTEPLTGTARRVLWRAVAGTLLIGFGLWLHQKEF